MVEIILARHGETAWNAGEIFRGRADVPLSDTGLEQAERLADYLSAEKIDVVYSSPLQRAVRTAGPIARRQGLEVNVVENLNDIHVGAWQGLTKQEVIEEYPELYRGWVDNPDQVRLPGGESLADVRSRVMPFIEDTVLRSGEGKVVLVSHRAVSKVLICALLGLANSSFWNIKLDTGGITRFIWEGDRIVLTSHNDTCYLGRASTVPSNDF